MVEDMFSPRVRDQFSSNARNIEVIEVKEPIDKFVDDLKRALEEYNRKENHKFSLKIIDGNREVGILS